MKTAVIYSSKNGGTENLALRIAKEIPGSELFNLDKCGKIDLTSYDKVILGASIYAGNIRKAMKKYSEKNIHELLQKKLGLFICAMDKERYEEELENAFPELLRNHSDIAIVAGGEFNMKKMNLLERMIVKKVSGVKESVKSYDEETITNIVNNFKN